MESKSETPAEVASYKKSPLQLTPFNDLEDELFGATGTPEREEYEGRIKLETLPTENTHE